MVNRSTPIWCSIALGACGLLLVSGQAFGQSEEKFSELDYDKDGRLSYSEASLHEELVVQFNHLDADQDGYLTGKELADYTPRDQEVEEAE